MTFLLFVPSGSTALLHPPSPLYGRLLSNNKDEDLLGRLPCFLLSVSALDYSCLFPVTDARNPAGTMSTALESYINRTVAIVTSDGRMIVGTLKGFDQTINLILDESHERVFSSSQGVEQVVLGLYIVRGDNVAVIGEIDEDTDSTLDLGNIRAEPLNSVAH
ncbi:hypothetical protein SMAX5B_018703 [Scophthalmus maximus]|uniref:U6 snRNA-associated Sm-like protein LSm8 n=2 Tax=Percomorphaceae TaxID=1489872 RepID=A0A2U9B333_SCOMX|nr:hypothetical protein SMAX5B_018703 [Scophthalmus maximus]